MVQCNPLLSLHQPIFTWIRLARPPSRGLQVCLAHAWRMNPPGAMEIKAWAAGIAVFPQYGTDPQRCSSSGASMARQKAGT